MRLTTFFPALLLSLAVTAAPVAKPSAPGPAKAASEGSSAEVDFPLGPQPAGTKIVWAHAPYEDGDCSLCHERKDPKNPGKLIQPITQLCESCHDEFVGVMSRTHLHNAAKKSCSNCHNAHNSTEKKLLHAPLPKLCETCHEDTVKDMASAKVRHLAVEREGKCMNCHNPHASNSESLLVKAPYDLCVTCHGKDDVKDGNGKTLTNIGKLVEGAKTLHKPVAEKDCSACHSPHASENFRLLVDPYPAEFYSAFDGKKYALCFECHKADIVNTKETTTLTRFRDGKKNLHYTHVNLGERGRTCRACHEVHAANQLHIIRDAVPYGPRGWLLKNNFHPTPTGGTCDKTCHAQKTYAYKEAGAPDPGVAPTKGGDEAPPASSTVAEAKAAAGAPGPKSAAQSAKPAAPPPKK
jgi:predicted CXXCH cytochrome family protein